MQDSLSNYSGRLMNLPKKNDDTEMQVKYCEVLSVIAAKDDTVQCVDMFRRLHDGAIGVDEFASGMTNSYGQDAVDRTKRIMGILYDR